MRAFRIWIVTLAIPALASGQIVVFPNRVTTVEKLTPELRAYRDAARRAGSCSSDVTVKCSGSLGLIEIWTDAAEEAFLLDLGGLEILNKYPYLAKPRKIRELGQTIAKALGYPRDSSAGRPRWFAFSGKAFVFFEPSEDRFQAWRSWVKGKPDLCFAALSDPSEELDVFYGCTVGPSALIPTLVTAEGMLLICADPPPAYSERLRAEWAWYFIPRCGSPFAEAASAAEPYELDPELNGLVIDFGETAKTSRFWLLPAAGGKLRPLKSYKPKNPTSR
jgi:hypothetical protein